MPADPTTGGADRDSLQRALPGVFVAMPAALPIRVRVAVWLTLVAIHVGVGALGWFGGNDRAAAIVAGSIYLPLWPVDKLGIPVLRSSGWYFPPPTAAGWLVVVVFWLGVYWCVATLIAYVAARRVRTD